MARVREIAPAALPQSIVARLNGESFEQQRFGRRHGEQNRIDELLRIGRIYTRHVPERTRAVSAYDNVSPTRIVHRSRRRRTDAPRQAV